MWRSDRADDEGLASGVDDFAGQGVQAVDVEDPFDLGDEAGGESEVPAGDPGDGGYGFEGGVVVAVVEVKLGPVAGEDEGLLIGAERAVVVQRGCVPGSV
jgi:hypothetical protein